MTLGGDPNNVVIPNMWKANKLKKFRDIGTKKNGIDLEKDSSTFAYNLSYPPHPISCEIGRMNQNFKLDSVRELVQKRGLDASRLLVERQSEYVATAEVGNCQ